MVLRPRSLRTQNWQPRTRAVKAPVEVKIAVPPGDEHTHAGGRRTPGVGPRAKPAKEADFSDEQLAVLKTSQPIRENKAPGPVTKEPVEPSEAVLMAAMRLKYRKEHGSDGLREQIEARLPTPTAIQYKIETSPAKRKVVCTGRRVGKTTEGARVAIKKSVRGRRVLLASTSQDQADAFWEKCTQWLEPFILSGEVLKNETKRTLVFPSFGGRIKVKTASDANALRGDYADFLILDECALLDPSAWYEVGAPMLLDNDGEAWFLSTPKRKNWFYDLYKRAEEDKTGRWEKFHATSFDNPHLSEAALAEIMSELTEDAYKQEILAIFLDAQGVVFKNISANLCAPDPADRARHRSHHVVGGLDWGQRTDYTCYSIVCADCMEELALERFNQMKYSAMRSEIADAHTTWYVKYWLGEVNSMGQTNIEALEEEHGIIVEPFETQLASKADAVKGLQLSLERQLIKWLDRAWATSELESFEELPPSQNQQSRYAAAPGKHDDSVIARMLSNKGARDGRPAAGPSAVSYAEMGSVSEMSLDPEEAGMVGGFGLGELALDFGGMRSVELEGAPGYISYGAGMGYDAGSAIARYTGLR